MDGARRNQREPQNVSCCILFLLPPEKFEIHRQNLVVVRSTVAVSILQVIRGAVLELHFHHAQLAGDATLGDQTAIGLQSDLENDIRVISGCGLMREPCDTARRIGHSRSHWLPTAER